VSEDSIQDRSALDAEPADAPPAQDASADRVVDAVPDAVQQDPVDVSVEVALETMPDAVREGSMDESADAALDASAEPGGEADADAPADSLGDGTSEVDHPTPVDSKQKVTFRVTSSSGAPKYLVVGGLLCDPFQIERSVGSSWEVLPLRAGETHPGSPCCTGALSCDHFSGVSSLVLLNPGDTFDMAWDARALVLSEDTYFCKGYGQSYWWSAPQPVPPGLYRVTIGLEPSLPPNCQMSDPIQAHCPPGLYATPPPVQNRCSTPLTAVAELTLPAIGDLTVPVVVQ
jgi:hypothetical protein